MTTIYLEKEEKLSKEKYADLEELFLDLKKIFGKKKTKKDPTIRLQKTIEDKENTTYGPFYTAEDFLKHLHSNKD